MGLEPGTPISAIPVDVVFIGSCTNGRIEDLRSAARVFKGRKTAAGVQALVVPGSEAVRHQAEAEGLDRIFLEAGAEWRQAGCSMCLAMNPDKLKPGQRSASTSNRNFEGRQGPGGRTHLVSPAMAAAAAVTGHFTDVRRTARRSCQQLTLDATERNSGQIMEPFVTHRGRLAVLDWSDVNTDLIIPARYLKKVERIGFGPLLFADKRYAPGGAPEADIPTSTARSWPISRSTTRRTKGATVLVVGQNFGCGSSREHAVWAVMQAGYRAVIAPGKGVGFADIFESNAFQNGLLVIELDPDEWQSIAAAGRDQPGTRRGDHRSPRPDGQAASTRVAAPADDAEPSLRIRGPRIPPPSAAPRARRDRRDLLHESEIKRYEQHAPAGSSARQASAVNATSAGIAVDHIGINSPALVSAPALRAAIP